jgi:ribosomal protein L37AE/L43A
MTTFYAAVEEHAQQQAFGHKAFDCPFTLNADGLWQCPDCGWIFSKRTDKPPRRNCPSRLTPEQKALYKAFRIEGEDTKSWLKKLNSEFEIAKKEGKDTTVLEQAIAEAEKREAARAEQEKLAKHGTGTYLHKLIKKLTGEDITPNCPCKSRIAEMNRRGPAWCRENVEAIVGWLEEEIERRLKEDKPGWRLKLAGYNLPGQRLAIKRVILLACTLAERAERSSAILH